MCTDPILNAKREKDRIADNYHQQSNKLDLHAVPFTVKPNSNTAEVSFFWELEQSLPQNEIINDNKHNQFVFSLNQIKVGYKRNVTIEGQSTVFTLIFLVL